MHCQGHLCPAFPGLVLRGRGLNLFQQKRPRLREVTQPGRTRNRKSPCLPGHIVLYGFKGSAENGGRKWPVVCPQIQEHMGTPPTFPAPGAPVCDCWATLNELPPNWSGMGQELEFVTSFPGGTPRFLNHILRPSGLMASANIAGFFQVLKFSLPTPPPTRSFASGCQRGGTNSVSPGFLENPQKS